MALPAALVPFANVKIMKYHNRGDERGFNVSQCVRYEQKCISNGYEQITQYHERLPYR